jgi:hypothetical protein
VDNYYGVRIETALSILPDTVTFSVKSPFGASALAGRVTGGSLVITGNDAAGKPVSLSARLPVGGFLSGPGVGGSFALAGQLTGMKVGDKRTLASLEIVDYPAVAIVVVGHNVERKPDARSHRRFAVTSTRGKRVTTIELELDDGVFSQRLGPPLDIVVTRIVASAALNFSPAAAQPAAAPLPTSSPVAARPASAPTLPPVAAQPAFVPSPPSW